VNTTPKPIVIALTGRPGTGKDTLASMIAPALGFQRIAFADALRREIAEAWRVDQRFLTERETKEWAVPLFAIGLCSDLGFLRWCHEQGLSLSEPRSPRWLMQNWGDYKRRYTPDHYAQIVARWIHRHIGTGWSRFVITDLRYTIEREALEPFDAKIIRINRRGVTPLSEDTANHSSERYDLITPHRVINNDSDIPQLAWDTLTVLRAFGVDVDKDPGALWPELASDVMEGGAA